MPQRVSDLLVAGGAPKVDSDWKVPALVWLACVLILMLTLTHTTSGTAAAGIGSGMAFVVEDAAGNADTAGTITTSFTTATSTACEQQLHPLSHTSRSLTTRY